MPKLIISRHGLTDYNAQQRYQGQSDIALNETGLAQAEALRRRLAPFKIDAAYCSDLQRARRTAEIALRDHPSRLTAQPTALLREVNGGGFEGLVWDEITARYPAESSRWREDRTHNAPPDGENLLQVVARVQKSLAEILEGNVDPDRNVLLVAHGGTIGVLLCHLMGMDLNRIWQWRVDTCSLTILDIYQDGAILSLFNDTAHVNQKEGS